MRHRPTLTAIAAVAALALAACGGDDADAGGTAAATGTAAAEDTAAATADPTTDTTAEDTPSEETAAADVPATGADDTGTAATGTGSASGGVVTVTSVDYAFEDLPAEVPVGTELQLTNASDGEVHEIVAFRLAPDEDRPLGQILAEADPEGPPPGAFAGVVVAMPGEDGFAPEGPVVLDEPGRYLLLCAIPTGADPQAYAAAMRDQGGEGPVELADAGPPHFVQGMVAELTVSED